ncbi:MAG: potassium channel family protein [Planctomycetota bacterium]|jgi:hypothetical protein
MRWISIQRISGNKHSHEALRRRRLRLLRSIQVKRSIERITANRYNHLLTMLLLFLWTAPFVERGQKTLGYRLITMALLCILVLCLRATIASKRMFRICVMILALALFFDVVGRSIEAVELRYALIFISGMIYAVFISLTIIILMRNMFKCYRITSDIIVGGICIYLLIGILWALFFALVMEVDADAVAHKGLPSLYYFSFTTLTTLGYGDIVPQSDLAKVLTSMEALLGQIYLTVFVARLVGLHIAYEMRHSANSDNSQIANQKDPAE